MSNCIKCQASLQEGSKFCRRCGTEQITQPEQIVESTAVIGSTSSFSSDNKTSPVSSSTDIIDYSTKKMTTNPLPSPPPNATTMPMTQVIENKRKRGLFIGGIIFFAMIVFAAIMTYGVIYHLNNLRANSSVSGKKSTKKSKVEHVEVLEGEKNTPAPNLSPIPSPSPINSVVEALEPTKEKMPDKDTFQTPNPLPIPPEPAKKPAKEPAKEIPRVDFPTKSLGKEEPLNENGQITDVGVLGVKFKLVGEALVKIRGKQIYVVPALGSSITDVSRSIINPLPSSPAFISARQRSSDPVNVRLIERPLLKNQFTATFVVASQASNINQSVTADLGIRWQAALGK